MIDNILEGNTKSCVDILGNTWNYDCMGCSITGGNIIPPGGLVYDGTHCLLAADPEIPIPGFLIINTKRHIKSFRELNKEEINEITNVLWHAEKALDELNISSELTIVQEERSRHLHIWIYPNYPWMTEKFGKGVSYLRDISEYARNNSTKENVDNVLDVVNKVRNYFKENYKD